MVELTREMPYDVSVERQKQVTKIRMDDMYSNQQNKDAYAIAEEWMALERKHGA